MFGIGIAALAKPVHLAWLQQPCVLAELREIRIRLEQFLGLDMTIVERIDEVEADIASNQIEARRTPAGNFLIVFSLGQKFPFFLII